MKKITIAISIIVLIAATLTMGISPGTQPGWTVARELSDANDTYTLPLAYSDIASKAVTTGHRYHRQGVVQLAFYGEGDPNDQCKFTWYTSKGPGGPLEFIGAGTAVLGTTPGPVEDTLWAKAVTGTVGVSSSTGFHWDISSWETDITQGTVIVEKDTKERRYNFIFMVNDTTQQCGAMISNYD